MSYFKLLVIIFSFFFTLNTFAVEDIVNDESLYLSKEDLNLFKQSLKEGDKAKWSNSLKISKKIKNNLAKNIITRVCSFYYNINEH